jgi:hypothetical protein
MAKKQKKQKIQHVRVEVSEGRAYTYEWDGKPPLQPGDLVVLPGNIVQNKDFTGKVLRVLDGPDTDYPLKRVLRRVDTDLL